MPYIKQRIVDILSALFEKGVDKSDFIEYNNSRMTISH